MSACPSDGVIQQGTARPLCLSFAERNHLPETGLFLFLVNVVILTLYLKKFQSDPASQESIRSANVRRARRAVEDGQFRKAIQSLSSAGFAPSSVDALNVMRSKHPPTLPPSPFPSPAPPPVQVPSPDRSGLGWSC